MLMRSLSIRDSVRQLFRYFRGTVVRPSTTFEALASERSVRWAVMLTCLPVLQVWGNIALHAAFGLDWLGTRPMLSDPTFVAGFGHLRIGLANWVPVFAALMPLLVLLGLVIIPGVVQLMSKRWQGQGTFEQMFNAMAFAIIVPNMVIGATSEWLFSVPMDLIYGHPYWWNAAMQGEFGPVIGRMWNLYVFGIYIGFQYGWQIFLGSTAIRRIQKIPAWAAVLIMFVAFAVSMFVESVFVR